MIITVSGKPGSGKTTICNLLAKRLDLKHYYMGRIRRQAAKEKGMTLDELNRLGEKDPSTDKMVDDYLVKLGKEEDNFIAEGRTAFHFIPNSIKIFIDVGWKTGAERIRKDFEKDGAGKRNETKGKDLAEQIELLKQRVESDIKRYKRYYNIDFQDKSNYDFVIDTSDLTVEQVLDKVLDFIKTHKK